MSDGGAQALGPALADDKKKDAAMLVKTAGLTEAITSIAAS